MKILLVGSKNGKYKLPLVFETIISHLKSLNVEILGPHTQDYTEVLNKTELKKNGKEEIHSIFMRKLINQADLMVVETTFDGFALGHEATIALEKYVPVLALSRDKKDFSCVNNKRFFYKRYHKPTDIPPILNLFIEEYKKKYRTIRINVLIHQRHLNFLNEISKKQSKNKSVIIREVLDLSLIHISP